MTPSKDGLAGLIAPPGTTVQGNGDGDPVTFQIVIEFRGKSGTVSTNCTDIDQRMLCLGLLEVARDAVFKRHLAVLGAQQAPPKIALADGPLPPFPGRG